MRLTQSESSKSNDPIQSLAVSQKQLSNSYFQLTIEISNKMDPLCNIWFSIQSNPMYGMH